MPPTACPPPSRLARAARFPLLGLLLVAACLGGCSESKQAQPVAPVLVIGIDGLEWSVLGPLVAEGRCPNLRGLMERGSYGRLATYYKALSPIVWTTIATGKSHRKHGITGFVDGRNEPFTSTRRGTAALWNIATAYGLSSNVCGWWITWPAEDIRGVMVSGSSSAALVNETWKPALLEDGEDQVHPVELNERVLAIAKQAGSQARLKQLLQEKVFGDPQHASFGDTERKIVQQSLWSVQSDATYVDIATDLLRERPADLNMVYIGGPDVVGHRFWRQYRPDGFAWARDPEADAFLASVIPDYYAWADELVGQLLAVAPEGVTVLVVSDHGMAAYPQALKAPPPPQAPHMTGHHLEGNPGVIIGAGPGIVEQGGVDEFLVSGKLPLHGQVSNVAQTVLALLGIPVGRDMDGRAVKGMLTGVALENMALPPVESHDADFRRPFRVEVPQAMSKSYTDRFAQLGYLDVETSEDELRIVNPDAAAAPEGDAEAVDPDAGQAPEGDLRDG